MTYKLTAEQQKKKDMIEFLKHILPYWESDDLDDYMYIVHHYDLERVATKIQDLLAKQKEDTLALIDGMEKFSKEVELWVQNQDIGYNQALSDLKDKLNK